MEGLSSLILLEKVLKMEVALIESSLITFALN
jgi:hypothetical protein